MNNTQREAERLRSVLSQDVGQLMWEKWCQTNSTNVCVSIAPMQILRFMRWMKLQPRYTLLQNYGIYTMLSKLPHVREVLKIANTDNVGHVGQKSSQTSWPHLEITLAWSLGMSGLPRRLQEKGKGHQGRSSWSARALLRRSWLNLEQT